MKLKSAVKYRYSKFLSVAVFYYVILLFVVIAKAIVSYKYKTNLISAEVIFASSALLFLFGVCSFKPEFKLCIQNGASRQDAHNSFLLFMPITVATAIVDSAFYYIMLPICNRFSDIGIKGIWSGTYPNQVFTETSWSEAVGRWDFFAGIFGYESAKGGYVVLMHILLSVLTYMALLSLGYMIAGVVYRLNRLGKIILPVIIVSVFAICFAYGTLVIGDGSVLGMYFVASFLFGAPMSTAYINHYIAALIMLIVIFTSGAHLLIRKAIPKK